VRAGEAKLPGHDGGDLPVAGPWKSKFRRGRLFVLGLILCAGAWVQVFVGVFCCRFWVSSWCFLALGVFDGARFFKRIGVYFEHFI